MPDAREVRAAFTPVRTERLLLRAVEPGDLARSYAIHSDPQTYRFHPSSVSTGRGAEHERLREWIAEWDRHGSGFWAICDSEPGGRGVLGFGGLTRREFHGRTVLNTYYRFDPAAWGHGYATEMVRAAYGLAEAWLPELPRIVRTRPANAAARRVAEKAGLTRRPELDDELVTYAAGW